MTYAFWYIKPAIEITILWFVFYRILIFFEGTRAFQVLKGITYLLIAFLLSQILGFDILNWLLTKIFGISIIAVLIIFQQELRQGLARLGQHHLFSLGLEEAEILAVIDEIVEAALRLSKQKHGCIIAIERETKLKPYIESGAEIDGKISREMLISIFTPPTPLHDGGVVTRGDRIIAAACLFPLSENPNFSKSMGTRHRAAIGLSEQTDAVIIVVSEETGDISLAHDGRLMHMNDPDKLTVALKTLLTSNKKRK